MTEEERIKLFRDLMGDIVDEVTLANLVERGFFKAPASTKYHGSYEGGLFDHSFMVAQNLQALTNACDLEWKLERSPLLVGMFHDICKMGMYFQVKDPLTGDVTYKYDENTLIKGHGDRSVMLLSQFFQLTDEEIVCIRYHMGAFTDKEEWKDYTNAIHAYPNVLWTHQADMIVSHIMLI